MTDAKPMTDAKRDTSFRLGAQVDDVYAALIAVHAGLSEQASARLNARLVLLLANQVGDAVIVIEAIRRARDGIAE